MSDKVALPGTPEQHAALSEAFHTITRIAGELNAPMFCLMITDAPEPSNAEGNAAVRVCLAGNYRSGHAEYLASVGSERAAFLCSVLRSAAPLFRKEEE